MTTTECDMCGSRCWNDHEHESRLRHLARHVDWHALAVVYALFTWGLWGNPRWWAGALAAPVIPVVVALRAHLLCGIEDDLRRERAAGGAS